MKSIKSLMKVVMISGLVITLNIFNIIPSFASEMTMNDFCNKYNVVNNGKVDNSIKIYAINTETNSDGTIITKLCNGSWYSINNVTNKYIFKPIESNEEISFSDEFALCTSTQEYLDIKIQSKQVSSIIKNSEVDGIGSHSDIIYVDNLQTDENLNKYATQWLKDNYNLTLYIPISYSKLDGIEGVFTHDDRMARCIKINEDLKNISISSEKVLIHELTHMVLFVQEKDSSDNTNTFKEECVKNGGNTNYGGIGILHSHLKCTI